MYLSLSGGNNNDINLDQQCRNDSSSLICNGRGTCLCGQCECLPRANIKEVFSGVFCECDNFSCERRNNELCSNHGTCDCGKCVCDPGYTDAACDCLISNEGCIAPGETEVCSGKGECICGKCECQDTPDGHYSGKYCDSCPTCNPRCNDYKDCVQCQMYKKGKYADAEDCRTNCTLFTPTSVEKAVVKDKNDHLCMFYDDDNCRFTFVVDSKAHDKVTVLAEEQLMCPPQVYIPTIIFGVIAAIVLIGMAMLLLWKLLTTIHDRREFARFEKERSMAKWDTVIFVCIVFRFAHFYIFLF